MTITLRPWQATALLAATVLAVYANTLAAAFQFDDYNVVVFNPAVHGLSAWAADLTTGIRPLLKLSYTLNWLNAAGAAWPFHLFNLAIHLFNSLLVYTLGAALADDLAHDMEPEERQRAALFCALLFALHPVQTEAVSYIAGRSVSLMATLYFGSLLAYRRAVSARCTLCWNLLSLLLFLLALAVKEVAATLPCALLLWERSRHGHDRLAGAMRRCAAHWLVLAIVLAVPLWHARYGWLLQVSLAQRSLYANWLTELNGVCYLLSRLFVFYRLDIDPDLPVLHGWSIALAFEALALAVLLATAVATWRNRPWIGFGLLWLFLQLLPTNSLLPRLDVANERQLYLASFGLFFAAGMLIARQQAAGVRRALVLRVGVTLLLLLLAVATLARNQAYRDEIALWEDTASKSPNKARVHNNLGYAYALAGRYGDAHAQYVLALRLQPDYQLARSNLAALPNAAPAPSH